MSPQGAGAAERRRWWSPSLAVYTTDDRARRIEVLRRIDAVSAASTPGAVHLLSNRERVGYLASGSLRIARSLTGVVVVGVVLFMMCGGMARAMGWRSWVAMVALAGLYIACRQLAAMTFGKAKREQAARVALAERIPLSRCGGCGYQLRGLPVEDDGCTVCPECGAAWKIALWRDDFPEFRAPRLHPPGRSAMVSPVWLLDARARPVAFLACREPREVRDTVRPHERRLLWSFQREDLLRLLPVAACAVFALLAWHNTEALTVFGFLLLAVSIVLLVERTSTMRGRARSTAATAMVEAWDCPCCTGRLAGRPAIADGAHPCAACGAAWTRGAWVRLARRPSF